MNRRHFIGQSILSGAALGLGGMPMQLLASSEVFKLTILHTNDMHSRIEPFPEGSKYAGLGGMASRAAIIKKIRDRESNVLLLDCGDIFQGTPYFNYYGGQPELELMSMMRYDAETIGNHDFDGGLDGLLNALPKANFPFVCSNYDFSNTPLKEKIQRHIILNKGAIKVGIFGLGIELQGLVPSKLFGDTIYNDPIASANATARYLKGEEKCHLVICLSHLGYKYKDPKVSDTILADNSENIDLILGGHTHTFLDQPEVRKNKKNEAVIINQVGWAGLVLGRIDVAFNRQLKRKNIFFETVKVL